MAYICSLIFSTIFISKNILHKRFIRKGVNSDMSVWYVIYHDWQAFKKNSQRHVHSVPVSIKDTNSKEIMVLVIGESLNRNHMSIYGYHRNTNPLLAQRKDIKIYQDIIAPFPNTIKSVLMIMSHSNLDKPQSPENAINLIDVFSSAGYSTTWISNQSPIGIWDNAIFNIGNTASQTYFVNQTSNSSEEATNKISYDEQVFEPFISTLNKKHSQFIVIHLLGNHTRYSSRYPKSFNVFQEAKNKEETTINDYDNSI